MSRLTRPAVASSGAMLITSLSFITCAPSCAGTWRLEPAQSKLCVCVQTPFIALWTMPCRHCPRPRPIGGKLQSPPGARVQAAGWRSTVAGAAWAMLRTKPSRREVVCAGIAAGAPDGRRDGRGGRALPTFAGAAATAGRWRFRCLSADCADPCLAPRRCRRSRRRATGDWGASGPAPVCVDVPTPSGGPAPMPPSQLNGARGTGPAPGASLYARRMLTRACARLHRLRRRHCVGVGPFASAPLATPISARHQDLSALWPKLLSRSFQQNATSGGSLSR